jgi:hypothetical protein
MRVSYRARQAKCQSTPSGVVYETARPIQWCCARMCQWWDTLIGFGVPGHPRSTSREVNLAATVPQANGGSVLEVVSIAFCPFCGESVEACRVK